MRVSSSLGLSFIGIDPKVSHKFSSGSAVKWRGTDKGDAVTVESGLDKVSVDEGKEESEWEG